jgi:hypothetical protein
MANQPVELFEVERVDAKRVSIIGTDVITEYLVKWKDHTRRTWEPEENLEDARDAIREFEARGV